MNVDKWMQSEAKMMGTNDGIGGPDTYCIGCADYRDREALMLIIEAARELCGMNKPKCRRLLLEALSLINTQPQVVSKK